MDVNLWEHLSLDAEVLGWLYPQAERRHHLQLGVSSLPDRLPCPSSTEILEKQEIPPSRTYPNIAGTSSHPHPAVSLKFPSDQRL